MYQKKRKKQKKRKEKFKTIQERYVHVEKKTRTECMSIRRSDQKERGKKKKKLERARFSILPVSYGTRGRRDASRLQFYGESRGPPLLLEPFNPLPLPLDSSSLFFSSSRLPPCLSFSLARSFSHSSWL